MTTPAAMIDSIRDHLAVADLDERAKFFARLDQAIQPHGLCVVAHPVEQVQVTSDEIDEADHQNEQFRRGGRTT